MGKVVLKSNIIWVFSKEFDCHGFATFEILLLVVGFAKVHSDLKIIWLMLKSSLIQIYGVFSVLVIHQQMGLVYHGMKPNLSFRLTCSKQFVDFLGFVNFPILSQYICNTKYSSAVVFISIKNGEVLLHGLPKRLLLLVDIRSLENTCCVLYVGNTNTRIWISLTTHL